MPDVNVIGIIAGTAVGFASGFLWFGPATFFPTWWRLRGKGPKDVPGGGINMGIAFGSVLVGQILQVTVLALILSALQLTSPIDGALVGLLIGVGIVGGVPRTGGDGCRSVRGGARGGVGPHWT